MQDSKPTPQSTLRIILWSLAATFALFCGGYYLARISPSATTPGSQPADSLLVEPSMGSALHQACPQAICTTRAFWHSG